MNEYKLILSLLKIKTMFKFIIFIIAFSFFSTNSKTFKEFNGGRFGYSYSTIKLYSDNTYFFTDWNHTSYSVQDSGKYSSINGAYILNSNIKTRIKTRHGKGKSHFHFKDQAFILADSILKILPKNKKDASFYEDNYTFHEKK